MRFTSNDAGASRPMRVAFYESAKDNSPDSLDLEWSGVASMLTTHDRRDEEDGRAWSPVRIEGTRVKAITAAVFDVSAATAEQLEEMAGRRKGWTYVVHSTHFSEPGAIKLRVVLPLSRDVLPEEWPRLRAALIDRFAIPADSSTKDRAHFYYRPSAPRRADMTTERGDGRIVDVDEVLGGQTVAVPARDPSEQVQIGEPSPVVIADQGRGMSCALPMSASPIRPVRVTFFDSMRDNNPKSVDYPWDQLVAMLRTFRETHCAPCPGKTCGEKDGPAWSPARYPDGAKRKDENVEKITAAVFDLDHITAERFAQVLRAVEELAYIIDSTHSHRPDDQCYRLVIPLSREVRPSEWPIVWERIIAALDLPADPTGKNLSRIYFRPSAPRGSETYLKVGTTGSAIDVDSLIASASVAETDSRNAPRPTHDAAEPTDFPPASPELLESARQRLRNHGPAIQGERGDDHTFQVGAILLHDYALTVNEAWPLALEWNATCQPPWEEGDLAQKLENGAHYAKGERGEARATVGVGTRLAKRLADSTASVGRPPISPWAQVLRDKTSGDSRKTKLAKLAGHLFRRLPAREAYEILALWNELRYDPPLHIGHLNEVVSSIAT